MRLVILSIAVLAFHVTTFAAPVTIHYVKRLTLVCDQFPVDLNACTPDDSVVRFSITYDPDTLVLDESSPYRTILRTTSVSYTISIAPLEDPWGGTILRSSSASAEFEGTPLGTRREVHIQVMDWDNRPECTSDGICDRWWITVIELDNFFEGDAVGTPTAADFKAALKKPGGPGSVFDFMTVASYTPVGTLDRVYLPASRFYYSDRVRHGDEPSPTTP